MNFFFLSSGFQNETHLFFINNSIHYIFKSTVGLYILVITHKMKDHENVGSLLGKKHCSC